MSRYDPYDYGYNDREDEYDYRAEREREASELDMLIDELAETEGLRSIGTAWLGGILAAARNERWPVLRGGPRNEIPLLTRRLVYRRDDYRCRICEARSPLQLDHIVPWSYNGSDRSFNLRTLCEPCNTRRSNYIEASVPRQFGVTVACDYCLSDHATSSRIRQLHDKAGLWEKCPVCLGDSSWEGGELLLAYCGTCDSPARVSQEWRIL